MDLSIRYEDDEVWIKMSPEEFATSLSEKLGKDCQPAIDEIVADLKKRTLTL